MKSLRPYLQLVRLPAVFTAIADIGLGFLITHDRPEPAWQFLLLILASSGLYLAGMALNDVFDREIDARERPNRPIPSGRVPLKSAIGLALALMVLGLVAAALAGMPSLLVAVLLAACILAYDGRLKGTLLGPPAMGACRFLNVMLGASAAPSAVWAPPQVVVAAGLGIYIVGVTLFARQEAEQSRRGPLLAAAAVVNLGLAWLLAWVLWASSGRDTSFTATVMLAVILVIVNRRMAAALSNPTPQFVQTAVKTMLLTLVVLDATLIYFHTAEAVYAIATLALLIPALTLGRWIFIT